MRQGPIPEPVREDDTAEGPHLVPEGDWRDFEMDIALYVPAFLEDPATYAGETAVDGAPAHLLRMSLPMGGVAVYAVDAASWLPVMVELPAWEYSVILSGYRDVEGVKLPTLRWRPADPRSVEEVRNLEVNPVLESDRFVFPPSIRQGYPLRLTSRRPSPPRD